MCVVRFLIYRARRSRLNEQGILNRRINTITAEKRALVTAKSKVEEELEEEKAKVRTT